jgi:trehalose synthase
VYNDKSQQYIDQYGALSAIDVSAYQDIIGKDRYKSLVKLADPLQSKTWANINSTFDGGGVAEMLKSVLPLVKGLGIDCSWHSIEGTDDFFAVTKKFHNMIQGVSSDITMEELFYTYLETVRQNFEDTYIEADMIVVHDPQPAAAINFGKLIGSTLWRCHIDTTGASRRVWRFLLPYINQYDGTIFTSPSFFSNDIQVPGYQVTPSIDPLNVKNRQYTKSEATAITENLFKKHGIDGDRPIVLAVSRYDIHKNQKTIIKAFKQLLHDYEAIKEKPVLIMVGNSASDDPEGSAMYEEIVNEIDGHNDIYPLVNIEDNDRTIGALMALANCFVHVSTREGFGLVVTEALWQGCPVIGSKIGGIPLQVVDGKCGFLVEPNDIDLIEKHMKFLLTHPADNESFSHKAVEHVREHFLLPSLIGRYLSLMRFYSGVDREIPDFRFTPFTYREMRKFFTGRNTSAYSAKDASRYTES